MTDLDTRLAALRRTPQPPPVGPDVVRGRARRRARRRHTVFLGAIAILIVTGGLLAFLPRTSERVDVGWPPHPEPPSTTVDTTATTPPSTAGATGDGWERWPQGPMDQVSWRAVVWTGTELVVWRGENTGLADPSEAPVDRAASYDPATREWTFLPSDPLGSDTYVTGLGTGGAWTGSEALLWAAEGMVAWRPAEGRWRVPAMSPKAHAHQGVWTGEEVLFVLDGVAYRPSTDSWRELALPPEGLEGSVNEDSNWFARRGDTIVVVGSLAGLYDVATDTWRSIDSPLSLPPGASGEGWDGWTASVFVLGDQILALTGTGSRTIEFDEGRGRWIDRPDLAGLVSTSEGSPWTAALPNGDVVVWHGTGVVLSPGGARRPLPPTPDGSESFGPVFAIDDSIVARGWSGVDASPAVQLHLG